LTVHRATHSLTARSAQPRRRWTLLSGIAGVTAVSTLVLTVAVGVTPALATGGTGLFSQSFLTNTVDPANGAIAVPAAPSGTNVACLTVIGSTGVLPSCGTSGGDASGSGSLRLTNDNGGGGGTEGGVFSATSVPASQGLDVTFNSYQFGGDGADGIAFALSAVNPANPLSPPTIGQAGGSLGYGATSTNPGLATGYLGFGFDTYGNFSNTGAQGSGCPAAPAGFGSAAVPNQVAIRGPGSGTVGYCGLQSTNTANQHLDATTKSASRIPVEVVINPTLSAFTATTDTSLSVPAGTYAVIFTLIGGTQQSLSGPLPSVTSSFYGAGTSSWLDANGIPKQLAFGWVASTGGSDDNHNIDNVVVTSINSVPKLVLTQTIQDVSTAAGGPTTVPQGSPVTYTATPTVSSSGANENSPITVTDTLPAGVTPTGASGNGWVCQPPSGQQVSCTNSNTPFVAGTTLPPITVNGTVTNPAGVAESTIETNTVTTASSSDALPSYSTAATGALPGVAPSALVISPISAASGTATTISGTAIAATSQIQIGTAAELLAGTAANLGLCPTSTPVAGCFTYDGTRLQIAAMPAHAVGATQVEVVASGTSAQVAFSYIAVPATSAAVVATTTTGTYTSASVTWTPGSNNGSAVTLWTVTPFVGSVAGTPWTSTSPAAASATLTGLTNGQTYTFQVVATNIVGGSTPAVSNSLVLPANLAVTTSTLPASEVSLVYNQTLVATGGTLPYVWTLTSGSLPTGLALSSLGVISGTATAANNGSAPFTVTATDANSVTSFRAESIVIAALPVVTTASLASVQIFGTGYSQTLANSGGTGPFTWNVTAGALPTGLSLAASTGIISGTPTASGVFGFTVTVHDANAKSASLALNIQVSPTPASLPAAPAGATSTNTASGVSPTVTTGGVSATGVGTGMVRVSSLPTAPVGANVTTSAVTGTTAGGFYDVAVAPGGSLSSLTVSFNNTPSSSIYWWNGTTWVKVSGTTRDPVTGALVTHLSATSVPNLSQLADATFAAGATPVTRIGGADRNATSIAASMAEFPGTHSASAVVLARSDVFADALTGGPLAAAKDAPVLLTAPTALSAATAAELSRVLAVGGTVYLLGGDSALSVAVEHSVTALGFHVVRIAGVDRFATSVQIAEFMGNPGTVFEVSGLNFPDAMSAGPAAIAVHGAIVLTNGSAQAAGTKAWLAANSTVTRYAVGGPAASADHAATPLSGADRYATATAVAAMFFAKPLAVGFATGSDFADALAAAPMLGDAGTPLLLVSPASTLPTSVSTYLSANADSIAAATVYGGTSAVSNALVQQVQRYTP
jgi:large repetitive protein